MRHLNLLRKGGLFQPQPEELVSARANNTADLKKAYHLVYETFLEQKFILPNTAEIRIRPWELTPETATFVSRTATDVVGVFSSIIDTDDLGLPSDKSFRLELDKLRAEDSVLCEMSNQAVAPKYRHTSVSTELMQCVFAEAWHNDVTDLLCAISPKQINFFTLMGFEQVGDIKSYSDVVFDPVALMRLCDIQNRWTYEDLNSGGFNTFWKRFFITENPYMAVTPLWNDMARAYFANPENISSLIAGCEDQIEAFAPHVHSALTERTGVDFEHMFTRESRESFFSI